MTEQANENPEQLTQEQRDAASAEKYRAQLAGQVEPLVEDPNANAKPERPAHIPEKFWDAEKGEVRLEEMAKSYAELEKKASQPKPAQKPAQGAEGIASGENGEGGNEQPDPYAEGVKEFVALREQMDAKLLAGEQIPDEMYARAEKHGFARADVDAFIAGQQALGQLARLEVHAEVGGEDSYKAMIEWAKANYTPEEVQVYNRDIHSGDKAVRLNAARGLAARFAQANGTSGRSVTEGANSRTTQGYASGAEMRADMRDPRYAKDPAFRAQVARKVAAARAAGVDVML